MSPRQIIEKKQAGLTLTEEEIRFFVNGYTDGSIPDYQAAALLMAIYFKGMNRSETVQLTKIMLESGEQIDFAGLPGKRVDKHSTGGVGDKLSLLAAPTVAACGGQIPMISGRGLGHTGGTLDKLESISGFTVKLTSRQIKQSVIDIGAALAGQTNMLTPADMKLYALRDVTGTVKSFPLIASSILSKKAAEGVDALVLDVKIGGGAIFPDPADMEKLAEILVETGNDFGIDTVALLTDMTEPLGKAVGNWLETRECIDIMRSGIGSEDLLFLNSALCGTMLKLSGISHSVKEGMKLADIVLKNGSALQKFRQIVLNQNGSLNIIDSPDQYPIPAKPSEIKSRKSGYISAIDAKTCGEIAVSMGAGRLHKEDKIDFGAGIIFTKKRGAWVEKGDVLAILYAEDKNKLKQAVKNFHLLYEFSDDKPSIPPLIKKVISASGEYSWGDFINKF